VVENDARRPDHDPDPDAPFQPGDRVRVATRMPTGDRVTGTGSVVRWIAEGNPLSAGAGVVVAMDDGEQVEPWCYRAWRSSWGGANARRSPRSHRAWAYDSLPLTPPSRV
jgi:hypothetical protein